MGRSWGWCACLPAELSEPRDLGGVRLRLLLQALCLGLGLGARLVDQLRALLCP
jgi:hypothetical protein